MKTLLILLNYISSISLAFGSIDTTVLDIKGLQTQFLPFGKTNYIIYTKRDKNGPVSDLTFVEMMVSDTTYYNQPVTKIVQKWSEKDTLIHHAETIFASKDLKTLYHSTWWKRNGITMDFDFINKKAELKGNLTDGKRKALEDDFKNALTTEGFINWHCDIHMFGLLPFKEGAILKLSLYDPGFGVPKYEVYHVKKSEMMEGNACWVLDYTLPNNMGYQRFWISKKDHILIKEEDQFRGMYRYKLKTLVAE